MKRAFAIVSVLIVLCLAAVIVVPNFIDWNGYKAQAIQAVEDKIGLTLSIEGNIGFTVLPSPHLFLENVSVISPVGSKKEKVVTLDRLDVHVALMPLLKGDIAVNAIELVKPNIALERFENGKLNIMTEKLEGIMGGEEGAAVSSDTAFIPSISLDKIRIKDGVFLFLDHKGVVETTVQNINLDVSAKSLLGPYDAQGSLFYNGYALNIDAKTSVYDTENKMISPDVRVSIQPSGSIVEYAGVVNFANGVTVQGQTTVLLESLADALKPYNIKAENVKFTAKGLLTADATKLEYKDFESKLGDDDLSGSVIVNFAPFKIDASLKSKSGVNIASFSPSSIPFNRAQFDMHFSGNAASLNLDKSAVKLDDHTFNISGQYKGNSKGKRPEINVRVSSPVLNYDAIMTRMPQSTQSKHAVDQIISSLSLPVNLTIETNIEKLIWQKKELDGLSVSASFSDNALSVSNVSIKGLAGASIKGSGDIKDLRKAGGISAYLDLNAPDLRKLTQWLEIDSSSWPQNLKSALMKTKLSGDTHAMDMTLNITAMNGEVIAKGKVKTPFETPAFDNLEVQVKHKSLSEAVQIVSGAVIDDVAFKRPMDLFMKISQSDNHYILSDVKGDLSGMGVQGSLDLDLGGHKPDIKGALKFGTLTIPSVMGGSGGGKSATSSGSKSGGRWSNEPIDVSGLHALNAAISLSAQRLNYGAWPLIEPSLVFSLKDGVLDVSELKAGVFGGSISVSSKVQTVEKSRQPINIESTVSVQNADLGKLSTVLIGTKLLELTGAGNLDMKIKSTGASPAALIYDLAGNGTVNGNDIVLQGVDVTRFARALSDESRPGDTLTGLWKGTTKGGQSVFDTLDGLFTISEGVVHLEKMDLDGVQSAIETRGDINFPKWTLATKHKIIVKGVDGAPPDVPPFEMSFSGSLDNPAQTFGQGVLQDYMNRKIQGKLNKLLSDKLGLPSNDNSAPSAQQNDAPSGQQNAPPQQESPDLNDAAGEVLKGVLDGLLR